MAFYNGFEREEYILRLIIGILLSIDIFLLSLLVLERSVMFLIPIIVSLALIYYFRLISSVIYAIRIGKGQIEIVRYKTSFLSIINNRKITQYIDRANAKAKIEKVGIFSPSYKVTLTDGYHNSVEIIFKSNLSSNLQKWIQLNLNCPSERNSFLNYEKLRRIIPILPKKQIQELEYRYTLFISLILILIIVTGAIFYF